MADILPDSQVRLCIDFHPETRRIMSNPSMMRTSRNQFGEVHLFTIRMQMRRMTRLTNAFSKKWEHLRATYCLWFAYYNFCRIHKTLRVTPAMEAGITDHVWELAELLA
jgi:hypothetical protein